MANASLKDQMDSIQGALRSVKPGAANAPEQGVPPIKDPMKHGQVSSAHKPSELIPDTRHGKLISRTQLGNFQIELSDEQRTAMTNLIIREREALVQSAEASAKTARHQAEFMLASVEESKIRSRRAEADIKLVEEQTRVTKMTATIGLVTVVGTVVVGIGMGILAVTAAAGKDTSPTPVN